jgi:hypothetical protein
VDEEKFKSGFFTNDLHRHPIAYNFIKYATKLFSKSYLVKMMPHSQYSGVLKKGNG